MQNVGHKIDLHTNLATVRGRIAIAAERSGRNSGDVKLVAVTKTHPPDVVRVAIQAGALILGENKVQEGLAKIGEIGRDAAEWHLIGHLQKNKARKAVESFDVIETLDSLKLAERLERICVDQDRSGLSVLVQVDLAGEAAKSGVAENDLPELVEFLKNCKNLRFDGLMIIPPYFEEAESARPFFRNLRRLRDELAGQGFFKNGTGELSMGMSHDFEIAIEEGATIVRVGTAIFGERNYS